MPDYINIDCWMLSEDAKLFRRIIGRGIDAHLEAFTESVFEIRGDRMYLAFHMSEVCTLLRRLEEDGSFDADAWMDDIVNAYFLGDDDEII